MACDQAFEPLAPGRQALVSVFGYLNPSADTQWIRVMPIRPLKTAKPAQTTPFKQVRSSIEQTLKQQKQTDEINAWSKQVQKRFCSGGKIKYATGDEPNPGPCTPLTTSTPTTTG